MENDEVIVYGNPQNLYQIKEAIIKKIPNIEFDMDEITYIPKEKVTLNDVLEDREIDKKEVNKKIEAQVKEYLGKNGDGKYENIDLSSKYLEDDCLSVLISVDGKETDSDSWTYRIDPYLSKSGDKVYLYLFEHLENDYVILKIFDFVILLTEAINVTAFNNSFSSKLKSETWSETM